MPVLVSRALCRSIWRLIQNTIIPLRSTKALFFLSFFPFTICRNLTRTVLSKIIRTEKGSRDVNFHYLRNLEARDATGWRILSCGCQPNINTRTTLGFCRGYCAHWHQVDGASQVRTHDKCHSIEYGIEVYFGWPAERTWNLLLTCPRMILYSSIVKGCRKFSTWAKVISLGLSIIV